VVGEGQIDVIRCHDAGVTNSVAAQGTAVTEDHARILRRYADEVVLVLDADTAGENAAMRSTESFYSAGLSVRAVALPEGEDPDTIILKHGPEVFKEMIAHAQPFVDYQIDILSQREDPDSEAGAMRVAREVMKTINNASSAIQRDHLIQHAAKRLNVPEEALRSDLKKVPKPRRPAEPARDHFNLHEAPPQPVNTYPPQEIALLEIICNYPETGETVKNLLPLKTLSDTVCRQIVEVFCEHGDAENLEIMGKLDTSNPECSRLAAQIQMNYRSLGKEIATPEDVARELIVKIRKQAMERNKKEMLAKIASASPDEQEVILVTTGQLSVVLKSLDAAVMSGDLDEALEILEMYDD
jgi:DNA primase